MKVLYTAQFKRKKYLKVEVTEVREGVHRDRREARQLPHLPRGRGHFQAGAVLHLREGQGAPAHLRDEALEAQEAEDPRRALPEGPDRVLPDDPAALLPRLPRRELDHDHRPGQEVHHRVPLQGAQAADQHDVPVLRGVSAQDVHAQPQRVVHVHLQDRGEDHGPRDPGQDLHAQEGLVREDVLGGRHRPRPNGPGVWRKQGRPRLLLAPRHDAARRRRGRLQN